VVLTVARPRSVAVAISPAVIAVASASAASTALLVAPGARRAVVNDDAAQSVGRDAVSGYD
jgi:hypothetical protein